MGLIKVNLKDSFGNLFEITSKYYFDIENVSIIKYLNVLYQKDTTKVFVEIDQPYLLIGNKD